MVGNLLRMLQRRELEFGKDSSIVPECVRLSVLEGL